MSEVYPPHAWWCRRNFSTTPCARRATSGDRRWGRALPHQPAPSPACHARARYVPLVEPDQYDAQTPRPPAGRGVVAAIAIPVAILGALAAAYAWEGRRAAGAEAEADRAIAEVGEAIARMRRESQEPCLGLLVAARVRCDGWPEVGGADYRAACAALGAQVGSDCDAALSSLPPPTALVE